MYDAGGGYPMMLNFLVRAALCDYLGWDYPTEDERKAGKPSLVARNSRLAPDHLVWRPGAGLKWLTVCCVLVAGVLGVVYDKVARWTPNGWKRMMVQADDPWGLVGECIDAGIGFEVTTVKPDGWYVWQGWNDLQAGKYVAGVSKGHQGMLHGTDGAVEATTYGDEDGDGKRTDEGKVLWHRLTTLDSLRKRYKEFRIVELRDPTTMSAVA